MWATASCESPATSPGRRYNIGNLLFNTILALGFEWGIGLQPIEFGKLFKDGPDRETTLLQMREFSAKAGRQVVKDYVAFPALTSLSPAATYTSTLKANVVANVIRNIWANAVIFCGHFPDGAEKFTKTDMIGETKGQWYLRQMLGSANFDAGPALRFMSGNLCHQIEHHLLPRSAEQSAARDLAARAASSATSTTCLTPRVHSWCSTARRGAPSPNCRCRTATCATPPTTRRRPAASGCSPNLEPGFAGTDLVTGRRRGLKTAIAAVRQWRRDPRWATTPTSGIDQARSSDGGVYWPVTYGTVGYAVDR